MDVKTQSVEQYLFEQLNKVAPGKYGLASVLQYMKEKLRFQCNHLKGRGVPGVHHKDYNFSIFTFPNGVTEIKCLYNCGLKIRSDEKELVSAFKELADLPTSNSPAKAEERYATKNGKRIPVDPGPVPVYTDAQRQRIKESGEIFLKSLQFGLESGRILPGDEVLGGIFPHPDPVEAPDSIVERGIKQAFAKVRGRKVLNATVVAQDKVPALKPVRKRKTQSRQRKRSGQGRTQ